MKSSPQKPSGAPADINSAACATVCPRGNCFRRDQVAWLKKKFGRKNRRRLKFLNGLRQVPLSFFLRRRIVRQFSTALILKAGWSLVSACQRRYAKQRARIFCPRRLARPPASLADDPSLRRVRQSDGLCRV